ncbi:transglycosylase SLT domain-containing protein [Luteimonas sp. SX5]|uniref:Transglycosylase SLT domain-containing protein n=1 Tax=Luteimonas galliterrae TaxID=2940486 RepID=A0ABT0MGR1_9GAMM|nr:lytic transglycosylase domain-containing protein [Luteimonas galliterrae]MCL1634055.1 transglycosylase SLT domain-containing protein [Luteimonas galliterrae]
MIRPLALTLSLLALSCVGGAMAQPADTPLALPAVAADGTPAIRSGADIYKRFREHLADPTCDVDAVSARWRQHFAGAPKKLTNPDSDVLPLFGYVVDALIEADLPTEFALIPFVESGYQPAARSAGGPAGLWQFIAITARNHNVPMRAGYDGRLSPVDSTRAAVRYLKTLHGMFAGDWRLAVMAYNAGEYRLLQSLRRSGQNARNARPAELVGLSGITYAYVRKLHALSCLLEQADDRADWLRAIDRQVPVLVAQPLPADADSLAGWARQRGFDIAALKRMNPAFPAGRVAGGDRKLQVLAPAASVEMPAIADIAMLADAGAAAAMPTLIAGSGESSASRTHTVKRGESLSVIARKYKLDTEQLQRRNGLGAKSVIRPGMVLKLDE